MSKMTNNETKAILTGRLSFANIFEVDAHGKYSLTLLIPKDDTETIEIINKVTDAAVKRGVSKIWNGKKPANIRLPLRDGDEKAEENPELYGAYAGHMFIALKSKNAPAVVLRHKDANGQPIYATPKDVYSGCYVNVSANFASYDMTGNKGITAYLGNVQKLKDGEPFVGNSVHSDFEFEEGDYDSLLD